MELKARRLKANIIFQFVKRILGKRIYIPLWIFLLCIMCIILPLCYITSYCIVLPMAEEGIYKYYAYDFYRPVEYLRAKSDIIWRLTECGYRIVGGHTGPLGRRNTDKKYCLRDLYYDESNYQSSEVIIYNDITIRKFFNYKGQLFAKYKKFYDYKKQEYIVDGLFYDFVFNRMTIIEDGKYRASFVRDCYGNFITSCTYRNNKPWNGEIIRVEYDAIFTYKNGRRINIRDFNTERLRRVSSITQPRGKGWPEIKDFDFPFKWGPDIYVHKDDYYKTLKLLNSPKNGKLLSQEEKKR